jgi:7-cyano-7-deazaguanine synthase
MTQLLKKAVVAHSGGMDSSLCLALAIRDFGRDPVLSLSFRYHQRHSPELTQAARICQDWGVDHCELSLDCLSEITHNALVNHQIPIDQTPGQPPNTLVTGRNGLMTLLTGIHAHRLGARSIYLGVIQVDSDSSGYRDCSREYMDLVQTLLRIDLADSEFEVRTPVINMTKKQTLELGQELGILDYLLQETITCYEGIPHDGCRVCPACRLRNEGIRQFLTEHPDFVMPYPPSIAEAL